MAKLPIAVLGAAHVHAPGYVRRLAAHPDVDLLGIYDQTASTARHLSEEFGTLAFSSVAEAVEKARAVAVCPEPTRQLALVQAAASSAPLHPVRETVWYQFRRGDGTIALVRRGTGERGIARPVPPRHYQAEGSRPSRRPWA